MAKARSNEERSAIVAASGMTAAVWLALLSAVRERGGSDATLYRLNTPEGRPIIARIAELIVGAVVAPVIAVAWSLLLPWLIAVCRFTSYVNPDITAANFSVQLDDFTIKEVVTVAIDHNMSTEVVLAFLDSKGLRPATLVELLWWWLTHPTEQSNCLVVALGSVWDGNSPYVFGDGGRRRLSLSTREDDWLSDYAFAAVSK